MWNKRRKFLQVELDRNSTRDKKGKKRKKIGMKLEKLVKTCKNMQKHEKLPERREKTKNGNISVGRSIGFCLPAIKKYKTGPVRQESYYCTPDRSA